MFLQRPKSKFLVIFSNLRENSKYNNSPVLLSLVPFIYILLNITTYPHSGLQNSAGWRKYEILGGVHRAHSYQSLVHIIMSYTDKRTTMRVPNGETLN